MKIKEVLSRLGIYSLTAASVVPSPIINYAFNLLTFGAIILLAITLYMAITGEEVIESTLAKVKMEKKNFRNFREGRKKLLITYAPVIIVMVACGHWIVAGCLFMSSIILLEFFEKVASKLGEEDEEK